ncbi:hypothetical protein M1N55_04575 [Dehalococcoidia bacterium]|nr:hypothetical protein [Dehalococcoidia bacterium]|tara:strand:+ start:71 stop:316 length:246 start_codon:yes stop_codon:yes gene_type:complete
MACLLSEPFVKRLRQQYGDSVSFLILDVTNSVSLNYAKEFRLYVTPSFLLVDGYNRELWRQNGGVLRITGVRPILEGLSNE